MLFETLGRLVVGVIVLFACWVGSVRAYMYFFPSIPTSNVALLIGMVGMVTGILLAGRIVWPRK
jgi:hypothetical protein